MYHKELTLIILLFFLIIGYFGPSIGVYSIGEENGVIKNNTWISIRDNLNITLKASPIVPIIDEITRLSFEIRNLNNSTTVEDLNAKVTMTDHDGRLYKFENKTIPISNEKFSVDYIFPDDGEHKIILQLYKNATPFTVSSFDMLIPHPNPQSQSDNLLTSFFDFFNSFLSILFR